MNDDTRGQMSGSGRRTFERYLEEVTWGLLFVLTGTIWILPGIPHPFGAWLVGVGVILLGAKAIAYSHGIPLDTITSVLAVVALAAGIGEFLAVDLPVIGLALLAFGAILLARPLRRRRVAPRPST